MTEPLTRPYRDPIALLVEYEGADDLIGDFTENLSAGGTFLATDRTFEIGTIVKLVLSFPGLLEPLAIAGTVRWTRGPSEAGHAGVGVEFVEGAERDRLADTVQRIKERDPRIVTRVHRLLLVEDNPMVSELIQHGLIGSARRDQTNTAFTFRFAGDGKQALELLKNESFDAVIIDFYLPGLDGAHVIAQTRKALDLRELPIIAFSAGGDAARHAAMNAGANIFLEKPMRLKQILQTLRQLLPVENVAA